MRILSEVLNSIFCHIINTIHLDYLVKKWSIWDALNYFYNSKNLENKVVDLSTTGTKGLSNQVRVIFDVSFIRLVASKYLDISHVPSLEAWSDKTRVEKWPGCCNEMRFN